MKTMSALSFRGYVVTWYCPCGNDRINRDNNHEIQKCPVCGRMWKYNKDTKKWEAII